MSEAPLIRRRILIVEDDWVVAEETARTLSRLGAVVVGPAATLAEAMALVSSSKTLHGAILDINLRGERVYPLVDVLKGKGVFQVFLTGYDGEAIPVPYRTVPRLQKPVAPSRLVTLLDGLYGAPV